MHHTACKVWNEKSINDKGISGAEGRGKTKIEARNNLKAKITQMMKVDEGNWRVNGY